VEGNGGGSKIFERWRSALSMSGHTVTEKHRGGRRHVSGEEIMWTRGESTVCSRQFPFEQRGEKMGREWGAARERAKEGGGCPNGAAPDMSDGEGSGERCLAAAIGGRRNVRTVRVRGKQGRAQAWREKGGAWAGLGRD
jgi:hypothetical protein